MRRRRPRRTGSGEIAVCRLSGHTTTPLRSARIFVAGHYQRLITGYYKTIIVCCIYYQFLTTLLSGSWSAESLRCEMQSPSESHHRSLRQSQSISLDDLLNRSALQSATLDFASACLRQRLPPVSLGFIQRLSELQPARAPDRDQGLSQTHGQWEDTGRYSDQYRHDIYPPAFPCTPVDHRVRLRPCRSQFGAAQPCHQLEPAPYLQRFPVSGKK